MREVHGCFIIGLESMVDPLAEQGPAEVKSMQELFDSARKAFLLYPSTTPPLSGWE